MAALVGSIPTRSRHNDDFAVSFPLMRRLSFLRAAVIAIFLTVILWSGALAQIRTNPPPQQRRPDPRDTIPVPAFRFDPPVTPLAALGRSMLVPGWGQVVLGRRVTGAAFVFWEGITLTMTLKAAHQLNFQEDTDAETVDEKRDEVQDWLVLLVFNHLMAGMEAFVAAHLWDFPTELEARALPGGRVGMGLSLYWSAPGLKVN